MSAEVIQFVDAVSTTANVRLSLTTAPWSVLYNGTDVSPPPLSRSVVNTLLVDGSVIPASAYDNRVIRLHLQLDPSPMSSSVAATQAQLLNRELDRTTNILKWQPDPALPAMFFRTFRSPDYAPTIDNGINLYEFDISLVAEPFAYGAKESLGTITVSNDPAAGANGKFADLTGVKGDVETPLLISIPGASLTSRQSLFAVRRRGTPSFMPLFVQAESMTMGTDTATAVGGASYSGGGSNVATCTFAGTSALVARLTTTTFPASAGVDLRGTYRVFVRTSPSAIGANVFTLMLEHGVRLVRNSVVTVTTSFLVPQMVDLGLVQIPHGFDPVADGYTGTPLSCDPIPFKIYGSRTSGSASLLFDYVMFVPADDCLSLVNWSGSTPSTYVLDGATRSVYGLTAGGAVADILPAYFDGNPPMVSPGITNRLVYIADVSNAAIDVVSTTVGLTCSYWPRYLIARPVST